MTGSGEGIVVLTDPIDQEDLPTEDSIEYTSLINIRPSQGNPGMEIQDSSVRETLRELTFTLLGKGRGAS